MVDVSSREAAANDHTEAGVAMSADGRYVTMAGPATNLVPGDTNQHDDVFVRDRWRGTTSLVSVSSTGAQGNNDSAGNPDQTANQVAISADGRYVAFVSYATNLVPGDTNNALDVFVRDRQRGTTRRVDVASSGAQSNGTAGYGVSMSADGRYVAFSSDATNLVPGDTNGNGDVFVRDLVNGTTRRVSLSSTGGQGNSLSSEARISGDGRNVAFDSGADNLVPGDTNVEADVFVRNLLAHTTRRVSVTSNGQQADFASIFPLISYSGRHVAFLTWAQLAKEDTNRRLDVYVHSD